MELDFHGKEKGQYYKCAKINIADNLNRSTDTVLFVLLLYYVIVIRTLSAMILLLYFSTTSNVVQFLTG
jgi:hypothetical protein